MSGRPSPPSPNLVQDERRSRRGGDQWQGARIECWTYRAAVVVHRLRGARCRSVAEHLGISAAKAYAILADCLRSPHLYHIGRMGRGWFMPDPTGRMTDAGARPPPRRG